ncbi:MAG: peptidylprolyl isomerase [Clostridia bacterium]|nr:peptidylprolyl isomerase [Clostridia bacterium]
MNQLSAPVKNDTVAVIKTNLGDIKVKFFPEHAPKAVENFITHAKNGYYNGIIFHRIIKDFMIQGGDPTGTGMGGQSIWGRSFEDEFTPELHNLCGALSMANAGPCTNGSQFFIVHASTAPESMIEQMNELSESYPADCVAAYKEVGGTPWLDYHHTVFGQVYDGMDIVNKIASVAVDGRDKPLDDVKIIEIEVSVL